MSKAVLIINMPKNCAECEFCLEITENHHCCQRVSDNNDRCKRVDYDVEFYQYEKPEWCPLKEVPQQREEKMASDVGLRDCGFIDGWNACIDKIMGGSEKE